MDSFQAGRFDEADRALQKRLQLQGGALACHLEGLCHLRAGRWREAKAELTICLTQRRDFTWPLVLRGFASSEQGAWSRGN